MKKKTHTCSWLTGEYLSPYVASHSACEIGRAEERKPCSQWQEDLKEILQGEPWEDFLSSAELYPRRAVLQDMMSYFWTNYLIQLLIMHQKPQSEICFQLMLVIFQCGSLLSFTNASADRVGLLTHPWILAAYMHQHHDINIRIAYSGSRMHAHHLLCQHRV